MTRSIFLQAAGLGFVHGPPGSAPLLSGLSFDIGPGLTLVRGGDGRGKTTLLRLLAGQVEPTVGVLHRRAASVCFETVTDPELDRLTAREWWQARAAVAPAWQSERAAGLVDAFGLGPHVDKALHMLSAGSRRKVGLVAAAACGAALTLLDTPFAALDAPSSRVLAGLLAEAAGLDDRAWVVADHERHPALQDVPLAGLVDLGDG